MTSQPIPPFAQAAGCAVGLIVTGAVLWQSYRTGKVGGRQVTGRDTQPVAYWLGMATGGVLFLVALGWAAVHVLPTLLAR